MSAEPNDADRARGIVNFGNTHGADLKHLVQAFADVRAEGRAEGARKVLADTLADIALEYSAAGVVPCARLLTLAEQLRGNQ